MENDNKFSYFFLGLGLGVAVGILFAPKSGAETRELLREKADEGKDFLRRRSGEFKESANEWVDRSKETLTRHRESLSAAVDAGKQAYRETVSSTVRPAAGSAEDVIEGV
jgi:gas vesicle protein